MELLVPMENLIDKESELNRLSKELAKKDKEFETIIQKLDNPNFLNKAPKAIVEKEELKKQRLKEVIKNLEYKSRSYQRYELRAKYFKNICEKTLSLCSYLGS